MLLMLLALQAHSPLAAQDTAAVPAPACVLIESRADVADSASAEASAMLYAACGDAAVPLGKAKSYRSAYNAVSRSLLVETNGSTGKRVLLLSIDSANAPHIDDVTRELTKLSGRYVEAGLANVIVDMASFAATGVISVPVTVFPAADFSAIIARRRAVAAKDATLVPVSAATTVDAVAPSGTATLDLKPYAARVAQMIFRAAGEKDAGPTAP